MKRALPLSILLAASLATPALAGPPAKRPTCQSVKARDAKRVEPCRRQTIPPLFDLTPMFLAAIAAPRDFR